MKDVLLSGLLIEARSKNYVPNRTFTDRIMDSLQPSAIFTKQIRRMNVNKKETFIMKLKHLPKFAIVAIAIGATVLLSGSAYAIYSLWAHPEIHVTSPETSASGRQEVSIAFSSCGTTQTANKYELKRDATIDASQIEAIAKARCELQAINDWAMKTYAQGPDGSFGDPRTHELPAVQSVRQLISVSDSSITFAEKKNKLSVLPEETLDAPDSIRFIANGTDVARSAFKPGDAVAYVTMSKTVKTPMEKCTSDACREFGEYRGVSRLVAVVKLDRDFKDYDDDAWQSLAELSSCMGNENNLCLHGNAASTTLYYRDLQSSFTETQMTKNIEGTVTAIENNTFTIKGTSGTLFTIEAPARIFTDFNASNTAAFNNAEVVVGSTVRVTYLESKTAHGTTIPNNTIQGIDFRLEILTKGGAAHAY
ncbi:MAG: hypothetical protein JWM52_655 [Candidatus Saccharibacteria bacterium]|nr:hypothetical protein [Candidatus Saccharibacteria bacterium]